MKYYKWLYRSTTVNLLGSSLALVLSIGTKDWSTATWSANAWLYTYLLRAVIRNLNNAITVEDCKPAAQGTKE